MAKGYSNSRIEDNKLIINPIVKGYLDSTGAMEISSDENIELFLKFFEADKLYNISYKGIDGKIIFASRKKKSINKIDYKLSFNNTIDELNKETQIWKTFLRDLNEIKDQSGMDVKEFINKINIIIEKIGEYSVEISLDCNDIDLKEEKINIINEKIDSKIKVNNYETIYDYIASLDEQILLPVYQRDYTWNKNQVLALINDIKYIIEESNIRDYKHFMGNILICDNYLIDGQQRLTTFFLLIKAINQKLGEQNNNFFFLNGKFKIKFTKKSSEVMTKIINFDIDQISEDSRLKSNYILIKKELENFDIPMEELFEIISTKLIIFIQKIESDTFDPNGVYETINNRSKPLTAYDLIKAYILKDEKSYEWLDKYEQIVENKTFGNNIIEVDEEIVSNKFRFYLAIKNGYLPAKELNDIKDRSIYKEYKKYILETYNNNIINEDIFNKEMEEMKLYFPIIDEIINSNAFMIRWIKKQFNDSVAILAVIQMINNENERNKCIKILANYCIIKNISSKKINDYVFDKVSKIFNEYTEENKTASELVKILTNSKIMGKNTLEKFKKDNFYNKFYSNQRLNTIMEFYEDMIYDGEKRLYAKLDLEHIYPQTPDEYFENNILEDDDQISRIGNVTLLEKDLNIKVSNKILKYKINPRQNKKGYKDSLLEINKELVKKYEGKEHFTQEMIDERSKDIINKILDEYNFPFLD